jgi:hypothetical protein
MTAMSGEVIKRRRGEARRRKERNTAGTAGLLIGTTNSAKTPYRLLTIIY